MRRFLLILPLLVAGCVLRQPEEKSIPVDASRELEIVDDATLAALSRNDVDGPLSFRRVVETLASDRTTTERFVDAWLHALGPDAERDVRLAWQSQTPSLERAPFRLLAVANRMDLGGKPGIGPSGEGRLVYALTTGPADDPQSSPHTTTLIFEFALPSTRGVAEWASAWHELGAPPLQSAGYRDLLVSVVGTFMRNDSLSQVRWNDVDAGMHQLTLDDEGVLAVAPLRNTPERALDGAPVLLSFVKSHETDVASDAYLLPPSLSATSTAPDPRPWTLPGVDDDAREAFRLGTCGGCHANDALDGGFHVSPLRHDQAKLSPMLQLDLERRADLLRKNLSAQ